MTNEQREMNIRRLRSIVRKTPDNAIDNVKIMKSDLFKLYSIAGLIDQKYNKNLDSMSKEEKLKAQDAINAAHLPADIVISDTVPIKNIDIDLLQLVMVQKLALVQALFKAFHPVQR